MGFMLCLPKISLSGSGCIKELASHLLNQPCRKPLIVTEAALVKLGLLKDLIATLHNAGFAPEVFDQVIPNPTDTVVDQAVAAYQQSGCDMLIGFGGGSSIDTAKAIRAVIANPGKRVHDFEGIGKIGKIGPMLVAVSTTSGTAAEVTSNAVIIDTSRQVKMVLIDSAIIPEIAVNDPELMLGLPPAVTAATGMDALTHAVEAYVSIGAHPLTDPTALASIRLIAEWLPKAVADGTNLVAREMMAQAQFLAGMAFNSAGLGYVHSLAHQPGATHNLPHGVCNAIILPVVCEFSRPVQVKRFAQIAEAMGNDISSLSDEEASKLAIESIRKLSATVGIPRGLGEFGITEADIPGWITPAQNDPCTGCAPRRASDAEIAELYRAAL